MTRTFELTAGLVVSQIRSTSAVAAFDYARIDNETPSFAAITLVAPGVRLSALAILMTPDFPLAIVFIIRMSSFVQARRTTFFAFAIFNSNSMLPRRIALRETSK